MTDKYQAFILKTLFAPVRRARPELYHPRAPDDRDFMMDYPDPYRVYPQFLRTETGEWYLRYKPTTGKFWVWLHQIRGMTFTWKEFLDTLHLYGFYTEWAGSGKEVVHHDKMPPNQMAVIEYGGWTIASFAIAEPHRTTYP